jgi:hypothetical protein
MTKSLSDALSSFVGLRCTEAKIKLGGALDLAFDFHKVEPNDIAPYIMSWADSWRIVLNGTVLAGHYDVEDWEHGLEDALAQLKGQTLTEIDLPENPSDARFIFGEHLCVEFFQHSREDEAWECKIPTGNYVDVGPGKNWRLVQPTDPALLPQTIYEERRSDHAEAFYQRWKGRIPNSSQSGNCKACAYWRMLHGHS